VFHEPRRQAGGAGVPTSQGTGQQTVVVNASSAEIYGLEIDLAAAITEVLLTANLESSTRATRS
jgi:hypothetical protein